MSGLRRDIQKVSNVDGAVVLDLRRGTMFRISRVGAKILDLLEEDTPPCGIAERLGAEFGVAPEIVEADIRDFIGCLELHGLIARHPDKHEREKETGNAAGRPA